MKPKYKKALIVTASTIIAVVLLLGAATLLLNTSYVQQRLLQKAVSMLAEKLNTRVEVDSVSVNLFVPSMALYGLRIDDQQGDSLLRMEQLTAQVSVVNLWKRQFLIQQVNTEGLDAKLVQNATDSVPNYQFLIDAFKKKDTPEKSEGPKAKKKWDVTLHPQQLHMQRTHICSHKDGKKNEFTIQQLDIKRKDKEYRYSIEGLQLATDNGTPRKNTANPRKGKFDAGHLVVCADGLARLVDLFPQFGVQDEIDRHIGVSVLDMMKQIRHGRSERIKVSFRPSIIFIFSDRFASPTVVGGTEDEEDVGVAELVHPGEEGAIGIVVAVITPISYCASAIRVVDTQFVTALTGHLPPPGLLHIVDICTVAALFVVPHLVG